MVVTIVFRWRLSLRMGGWPPTDLPVSGIGVFTIFHSYKKCIPKFHHFFLFKKHQGFHHEWDVISVISIKMVMFHTYCQCTRGEAKWNSWKSDLPQWFGAPVSRLRPNAASFAAASEAVPLNTPQTGGPEKIWWGMVRLRQTDLVTERTSCGEKTGFSFVARDVLSESVWTC